MRPNKGLFIAAILLVLVLGLVTIWSTVPDLFFTQLEFVIAGVIIVFLLSRIDTRTFFSISTGLYVLEYSSSHTHHDYWKKYPRLCPLD